MTSPVGNLISESCEIKRLNKIKSQSGIKIHGGIFQSCFLKKAGLVCLTMVCILCVFTGPVPATSAEQRRIILASINWEPYTGKNLPDQGFISQVVTEAFARTGYRVEFKYMPWSRALHSAKKGEFQGLMNVYWKKDRIEFFKYSDGIWKVKEEFICLSETPIAWVGDLENLKSHTIGVLRGSAQAEELKIAGFLIEEVNDQILNVKKLLKKRVDIVLSPASLFFYHLNSIAPDFNRARIKILKPAYKIYDLHLAFPKTRPDHRALAVDFNLGLWQIKTDGTFQKILEKHSIRQP